jgi:TonB-like protein
MRYGVFILALLIVGAPAPNQKHRAAPPMPDHFVIARDSFFDFGPPFHYLELFFVGPTESGSSIERILLTPIGSECFQPAKVETASALIKKTPAALLGGTNPCTIPEKELTDELKRRKHGLVFSGVNVVIQVQCGDQTRQVRSDILDRDIYAASPNTPEHTSWTMTLLEQLDKAIGNRVIDKPAFPLPESPNKTQQPRQEASSPNLLDVSQGKYDVLFPGTDIKASEVYRAAQILPPSPIVRLIGALDVPPQVFSQPVYPMLAQMVGVEGEVTFDFDIDPNGVPTNLRNDVGPVLLKGAVASAIKSWKFSKDASGQQVKTSFEFILTCKPSQNP